MDKAIQTYISVLKAEVQHLKSKLEPTDTGHIHTTISTLQHRIKELESKNQWHQDQYIKSFGGGSPANLKKHLQVNLEIPDKQINTN